LEHKKISLWAATYQNSKRIAKLGYFNKIGWRAKLGYFNKMGWRKT
jgi:hypothetical protein